MQSFLSVNGLKLAYNVDDFTDPWDTPQTLLLLHGAMGSARRFYSWVPRLCRNYRVVRLDWRGHGASDVPRKEDECHLENMVSDIVALLNHLECSSVHVVGNSAGGYIAQQLAIQHIERVRTLALFASTPGLKGAKSQIESWIPQMKQMGIRKFIAETISDRFPPELGHSKLVDWFLNDIEKNDLVFISMLLRHLATVDLSEDLHRISCPTLLVIPGAEPIGTTSGYAPMRQRIPRCEAIIYDNARHSICDYLPDRCVDDLLSFLLRHNA